MKVIILGAGASKDCIRELYPTTAKTLGIDISEVHKHPWVPPLGNELFSTRETFRSIISAYEGADAFTSEAASINDLEEYLDEIQNTVDKTGDDIFWGRLIHTQYYLQHLLYEVSEQFHRSGINNYETLIDIAYKYAIDNNDEVYFISFNYDFLLEKAFERKILKRKINSIDDYIGHRKIKIIKPHGSSNWGRRIKKITRKSNSDPTLHKQLYAFPSIMKEEKSSFEYDSDIEITHYSQLDKLSKVKKGYIHYIPQIILPLKTKSDFIIPESHKSILEDSLKRANKILTIGWKSGERKFLQQMRETLNANNVSITVVDPNADAVSKDLATHSGVLESSIIPVKQTFSIYTNKLLRNTDATWNIFFK